jgi:hypothetical protein
MRFIGCSAIEDVTQIGLRVEPVELGLDPCIDNRVQPSSGLISFRTSCGIASAGYSAEISREYKTVETAKRSRFLCFHKRKSNPVGLSATATIPEMQQSKTAVLNTLASKHSRRSYEFAIERFIAWDCSEPRLTLNRSVVVRYRSFLERLLSASPYPQRRSTCTFLRSEGRQMNPPRAVG